MGERGVDPGGDPGGGLEGCRGLFGPPGWPKNLKIRPMGYFFKLRSILMLPGLEIPLKSKKNKTGFIRNLVFNKW